ncbi:MAG: PRC-barrel domain-containing protein [Candidatus Nitrotoga sp.]
MNQDQFEGRIEEAKGEVKEVTGRIIGDRDLEVRGNIQQNMNDEVSNASNISRNHVEGLSTQLMSASSLIGDDVYNLADEDLGDIKEIMLDMKTGKISYAVLSYGGILGMGDKYFAVPWGALKLDTENKRFILDVAKDKFENSPGFDKDNWPERPDPAWINVI